MSVPFAFPYNNNNYNLFYSVLSIFEYYSQFYDKEAFLLDEERASMLPMIAAG